MKTLKKCFILLLVISLVRILNGCIPFWNTYFLYYDNYEWTSTENSDIEFKFYKLTSENSTDYEEMIIDGKVQPIAVSTRNRILINRVDNDIVNFDKISQTEISDIEDNIFRSTVQLDQIFNKYTGLTIEVVGKPIAKEEILPFMFSPLSYSSHTDNLELHTSTVINMTNNYFLKQFGTMTIYNKLIIFF